MVPICWPLGAKSGMSVAIELLYPMPIASSVSTNASGMNVVGTNTCWFLAGKEPCPVLWACALPQPAATPKINANTPSAARAALLRCRLEQDTGDQSEPVALEIRHIDVSMRSVVRLVDGGHSLHVTRLQETPPPTEVVQIPGRELVHQVDIFEEVGVVGDRALVLELRVEQQVDAQPSARVGTAIVRVDPKIHRKGQPGLLDDEGRDRVGLLVLVEEDLRALLNPSWLEAQDDIAMDAVCENACEAGAVVGTVFGVLRCHAAER